MAWIEVHQSLPTHRKTLAFADRLNIEPAHAVGHLTCLWLWALDNAPDGNLGNISVRTLARAAQWHKDPQLFADALLEAGLMDADHAIHDWTQYAGRLIERRKKDADRKRAERGVPPDPPPDVPPPSNGHPVDILPTSYASRARVNRTVPYRTGENSSSARAVAEKLVESYYGAQGVELRSLTRTMLNREIAIAMQLTEVGANSVEATRFVAWCRAGPRRPEPSDLRVYEQKRALFLANMQPSVPRADDVDNTGKRN